MSVEEDIAASRPYAEAVNECSAGAIGVVVGSLVAYMIREQRMTPEQIGEVFAALARIQVHMSSAPEVVRAEAAHDQLIQFAKETFVQPPEKDHGPG